MPRHSSSGTLAQLNPPHISLDEVPIMADYQPRHNFSPNHRGERNIGAQSAGASHPVQHAQSVMDGTPAHPLPTHTPVASEADGVAG